MGSFFFSNHVISTSGIEDVFRSRGHADVKISKSSDFTFVSTSKILSHNCNFLDGKVLPNAQDDDFIIGVGIYFYDGLIGVDALKKVFDNIETVLKQNPIYGHYAFLVRKGNHTYVFNDMSGMMRLYYCQIDDYIAISTSMLAVISTMKHPKFDKVRLGTYLLGKDIPFIDGVELFHPHKTLVITNNLSQWIDKPIPIVKRIESKSDAIQHVINLLDNQTQQINPIIGQTINVEITGGLDSRLVACILRRAGFNIEFVHFPGLDKNDTEIANQIAHGLNKSIYLQNESSDFCPDLFEKNYGEFDFCFNYFNHHASSRRNMRNLYQFTGGRGEVVDTPQLYSTKSRKLEDLVNNVDIARARGLFNSKMKTKIKQFLINLYCSYGYKPKQELSEKEITSFTETLGATLNDSRTISAYNTIATRYGMFSEWHFRHHVTDISFKAKKDRALTLSLISYMDTELGSFPFSSHVRTLGESVNEAAKHPFHYKKRKNLKDRLPDFILEIYKKKKNSRCFDKLLMSQINFDDYADIIQVNRLCRYPSVYNSVLERLYSIEILRRKFGFKF